MGSRSGYFLDYSAKSKIFNLPKHIQLLRCGPLARASATARQGRTAAPAIRWSVASGHEGHGSGVRWVAPPAIRAARAAVEAGGSRGRPGSLRFALGAVGRSGGDEETRTPDPLLAKEVLYQLSYVPSAPDGWWAFLDSNQRPLPYQGSALTS